MGRRRPFDSRINDGDDLSSLTNYDEKFVTPIGGAVAAEKHELFGSTANAQPFSYTQEPGSPSFGPTSTPAAPPIFGAQQESAPASAPSFGQSTAVERPLVFALRSDPTAYVYEYSDRLELYRYSPFSGMVLCNKKAKKR